MAEIADPHAPNPNLIIRIIGFLGLFDFALGAVFAWSPLAAQLGMGDVIAFDGWQMTIGEIFGLGLGVSGVVLVVMAMIMHRKANPDERL